MPYEFHEWEEELQPQAASSRGGLPPRKMVGIGILDPPVPPRRPPSPLATLPASLFLRIFAGALLVAFAIATIFMLLRR